MTDLQNSIIDIISLGAGRVKFAQGLWHVMDGNKLVASFRSQDEALDYARELRARRQP